MSNQLKQENEIFLKEALDLSELIKEQPFDLDILSSSQQNQFQKVIDNRSKIDKLTVKQKEDFDYVNLKLKSTTDSSGLINYFKFFIQYEPLLTFNKENPGPINYELQSRFSKVSAAYSIAKYFPLRLDSKDIDSPTLISYLAFTKFLYTFRFIESFRKMCYLIDNIELPENINLEEEKGLFKEFVNEFNKNNKLKEKLFLLSRESYKESNLFQEISNNSMLSSLYLKNKNKDNVYSLDLFYLSKALRNGFIHSEISASTGSKNPLVLFIISTLISDSLLKLSSNFFKEKILKVKYNYKI